MIVEFSSGNSRQGLTRSLGQSEEFIKCDFGGGVSGFGEKVWWAQFWCA